MYLKEEWFYNLTSTCGDINEVNINWGRVMTSKVSKVCNFAYPILSILWLNSNLSIRACWAQHSQVQCSILLVSLTLIQQKSLGQDHTSTYLNFLWKKIKREKQSGFQLQTCLWGGKKKKKKVLELYTVSKIPLNFYNFQK